MNEISSYDRLKLLDEQAQKLAIEKSLVLTKAFQSDNVDEIYKAQQYLQKLNSAQTVTPANGQAKSLIFDPFDGAGSMGYYHKPAQLSFDMLRAMAKAPIISSIIKTRKNQVADFCVPQKDKYSSGFVIEPVKFDARYDDIDELSDQDKRVIEVLTEFLIDCAEEEHKWDLKDFDEFVRMVVEDSLVLDQATFEVIRTRGGDIVKFFPTDSATMRIADSYDNVNNIDREDKKINGVYPSYVQLYQGKIINEYYPWELCFGVRNPNTSIQSNGYGQSELEILIANVTAQLNSDAYNNKFFRNGTAPKGALMVKNSGGINRDKIAELRREWDAMMSGVNNMHKTPILDADKVEWVDMQKSNRDMEFSTFQEYLIKVSCANYTISPEEIGFPLQGSKSGNSLGSKEGGKEEKEYSKEKGLKPLLKSIQKWINKLVIGPKSNFQYRLRFAGIDTDDSKEEEERLQKAVTLYMTVDEVRKIKGLDPLPDGQGKMVLNQIMVQQQQNELIQQQGQNPFTYNDQQDDNNPFAKALQDFWVKEMITK